VSWWEKCCLVPNDDNTMIYHILPTRYYDDEEKKFPSARTTIITEPLLFYRHECTATATVKFNTHTHKILLSIGAV